MAETPEGIDREERLRVKQMLENKPKRNHLSALPIENFVPVPGQYENNRRILEQLKTSRTYSMGKGRLNYSNGIVAGDALFRRIQRSLEYEAAQGKGVVRVKDGKPLTAHGAKLLGVPWPQ